MTYGEAGVRKPPKEETAFWKGDGAAFTRYGDLGIGACGLRRFEAKIDRALAGFGRRLAGRFAASGSGMACFWRGCGSRKTPLSEDCSRWRTASDGDARRCDVAGKLFSIMTSRF